jgi:hypothetical protein
MQDRYFRLHDFVTLRIVGQSPDSNVQAFVLKCCEAAELQDGQADITWFPNTATHPVPADATPVREYSEVDSPTAYIRVRADDSWDCFGEGHDLLAIFQTFLVRRGATFMHAAGLVVNGRGVVVCGRGGIGKSALSFATFSDDRLQLLSDDKLVATADGRAFRFPVPHAVYAYHHDLLPLDVRARFQNSKTQSRILGPLYENPITRPVGRAAKRWLVTKGGVVGVQAARVRPHYVQVHSNEMFPPDKLVETAQIDLFVFLQREGSAPQVAPLSVDDARSLLLSATYLELGLDRPLELYAQASAVDLFKMWKGAGEAANAFLAACPQRLHVTIPRTLRPAELQSWLLDLLVKRLDDSGRPATDIPA